jgi:hypothetical protein
MSDAAFAYQLRMVSDGRLSTQMVRVASSHSPQIRLRLSDLEMTVMGIGSDTTC